MNIKGKSTLEKLKLELSFKKYSKTTEIYNHVSTQILSKIPLAL